MAMQRNRHPRLGHRAQGLVFVQFLGTSRGGHVCGSGDGGAAAGPRARLAAAPPVEPPTPIQVNSNAGFLVIDHGNVENLETTNAPGPASCSGDWKDLVYFMKTQVYSPDVFIVQQLKGTNQLNELADFMTAELPGEFAGLVAKNLVANNPNTPGSDCPNKRDQTNGIIYRTGRMTPGISQTWMAFTEVGSRCVESDQGRVRSLMLKLLDTKAQKWVAIAASHWPTGSQGGPPCASANAAETVRRLDSGDFGSSSLKVWGVDTNYREFASLSDTDPGDYRAWYRSLNRDLTSTARYRDAVFARCHETYSNVNSLSMKQCLRGEWTFDSDSSTVDGEPGPGGEDPRIDFLWAARGSAVCPRRCSRTP